MEFWEALFFVFAIAVNIFLLWDSRAKRQERENRRERELNKQLGELQPQTVFCLRMGNDGGKRYQVMMIYRTLKTPGFVWIKDEENHHFELPIITPVRLYK